MTVPHRLAVLLAVPAGVDRLSVGIGMLPRGEVGLIFAAVGRGLKIDGRPMVDDAVFSAIVMMVVLTTLVTPPALKWSVARSRREPETISA